MTHIEVIEASERNRVIRRSEADYGPIWDALIDINDSEPNFPWLSAVEPYGVAVFNDKQLVLIVNELKSLQAKVDQGEESDNIDKMIRFIESKEPVSLIQLLGD